MADPHPADADFKTGRAGVSAPFCVADLRTFLMGHWQVDRRVFDRRGNVTGRFQGTLVFHADTFGLRGVERGRMMYAGVETDAERVLHYVFNHPDAGAPHARVLFPDGRFFHDLDLRTGRTQVHHLCGDDDYFGGFRVWDRGLFLQRWRVRGPRKDLILVSRIVRIDD